MNEGHAELQHAIDAWETRRMAAMRAAREAEIVLPFLRAAVEELDAFARGSDIDAPVASTANVESLRQASPPPAPVEPTAPTASMHVEPAAAPSAPAPEPVHEDAPAEAAAAEADAEAPFDGESESEPEETFTGFGRKSIASLIEEANRDKEATG